MMAKRTMRKAMMAAREALTAAERAERGGRVQEALIATPWFQAARTILLYLPIRGEVDTALLAERGLAAGKRLVLPRVQAEPRHLWLHQWSGAAHDLVTGSFGIREPRATLPQVSESEIDLVVVPGVAFDTQGNRLGYGGGYYDRTLPLLRQAVRVGLAYSLQIVAMLPTDPHDVRLDGVVTEDGVL